VRLAVEVRDRGGVVDRMSEDPPVHVVAIMTSPRASRPDIVRPLRLSMGDDATRVSVATIMAGGPGSGKAA
jgi:hypothetical protein